MDKVLLRLVKTVVLFRIMGDQQITLNNNNININNNKLKIGLD